MKVIYTCHYCGKEAVFGEHFCKEARKVRKAMKHGRDTAGNPGPVPVPRDNSRNAPGTGFKVPPAEPRDPDRDLGHEVPLYGSGTSRKPFTSGMGNGGKAQRLVASIGTSLVAAGLIAALLYGTAGNLALWILPLALAVGVIAGLAGRAGRGGRRFGELLSLVGSDRELAGRLIHAEAGRNPGLDRDTLIDLAIQRLLRDRLR